MAEWSFSVNTSGGRELTTAKSRRLTWRRKGTAEASFVIPGRLGEADFIEELVSDLTVRRDRSPLFRGRVGATSDLISDKSHDVAVSSADYGALLNRRLVYDADSLGPYVGVDAGTLAMTIVDLTQARTNGDLSITAGLNIPAGVAAPDTTLTPGKSIAAHLNLLQSAGVFDWEIDANLALNIYPGGRYNVTNVVLDYGGAVCSVKRTTDPTAYANAGRYSGDDLLAPVIDAVADIATREEGRWETQYGDRDIHDDDVLAATADAQLTRSASINVGYELTLTKGWWRGPSHVWVGDVITTLIKSGRLNVAASGVVEELRVELGESGEETVSVAIDLGFQEDNDRFADQRMNQRIRDLERVS